LRTLDGNAVECRLKEPDVVRVGAAYFNTQWYAATIGKHRPLGSQLAAIGWVLAGFFPRPEAILSSLRQRFANSTGSLVVRRIPAARPSTICERRQPLAIPESNDATCCQTQTPWALPSIDNPYAEHRRCHRQSSSNQRVVDLPCGSSDSEATTVSSAAKVRLGDAKRTASMFLPLDTPPCWHKTSEESSSVRRQAV
jgi:hypothetical protein